MTRYFTASELTAALKFHFGRAWPEGMHAGYTIDGGVYFASWPADHQRYLLERDRLDAEDIQAARADGGETAVLDLIQDFVAGWLGVAL